MVVCTASFEKQHKKDRPYLGIAPVAIPYTILTLTLTLTRGLILDTAEWLTRHYALNNLPNLVACGFASARISFMKQPVGLLRMDGKRPDGFTLVPWQSDKSSCWEVTVIMSSAWLIHTWTEHSWGRSAGRGCCYRKKAKYGDFDGRRVVF